MKTSGPVMQKVGQTKKGRRQKTSKFGGLHEMFAQSEQAQSFRRSD